MSEWYRKRSHTLGNTFAKLHFYETVSRLLTCDHSDNAYITMFDSRRLIVAVRLESAAQLN